MTDEAPQAAADPVLAPAPTERGWGKLLLAIAAFVVLPWIPQLQAFLPIEQTMLLFVPAVAACALVGWWAGGRPYMAIAWVILAQAAQAVRDRELLRVASLCHQEAEARGKWLRTRIKESAPQVLATG